MNRRSAAILALVVLVACSGCTGLIGNGSTTDGGETTVPTEPSVGEATDAETESPTGGVDGIDARADDPDDGGSPDDDADSTADAGTPEDRDNTTETDHPTADSTAAADAVLPVDVDRTWERTRELFDTDAEQPEVTVEDIDDDLETAYDRRGDPFQAALNVSETEIDTESARGFARSDRVTVDPNDAGPAEIEQVLVHEYVHAIQQSEGWLPAFRGLDDATASSTDLANVDVALREGGAVWATDQYAAEYQNASVRPQSERLAAEYEAGPDGDRYFRATYQFGFRYFDERIDDPDEFATVYENPPVTTEQLLHGLGPDEEPPTELEVAPTAESDDRSVERNDRLGELFVRTVLTSELDESTAAEAAAGWGDDRLVRFDGDDADYVWVLEWDTNDDADEFETAFDAFLEERTDDRVDETAVQRHDDRTVTVTVGPDAFRDSVTVTGAGADLEVTLEE